MNRRAFARAVVFSALFIACSPFIGEIRLALRNAFPRTFIPFAAGAITAALVAPCIIAIARIRTRRALRYTAIALALGLVAFYWAIMRTGIMEVDSVELFHFLEYGAVGVLFYLAFLPLEDGTLLPLTMAAGALVGTTDEFVQWLAPTRVGEARDVYLDVFAVACGLLFAIGLRPPRAFTLRAPLTSRRRLARAAVVAILWFAVFYQVAHLGYDIRDEQIGVSFYSGYTADQLRAAALDRTATWGRNPPARLKPFAIEDFYITEPASHVLHRNAYYEVKQFDIAWKENRILEQYYTPFLDLHSFSSGVLHRWPAAQRNEVEAKHNPAAPFFESPAGRERYLVRPTKEVWWMGALALAALMWLVVTRAGRA